MIFIKAIYAAPLILLAASTVLIAPSYAIAHSGPLNVIAVDACNEKAKSDACEYEGGHHDLYIGTCQYMATALMCVRNQPIQKVTPKNSGTDEKHTHNEQTEILING
jgi:hypothetical protein